MARERSSKDDRVCIATIATAHGVRGALKLRCFTERPEDVAAYGPLFDAAGHRFDLKIIGQAQGGVIARARGIEDRDQALALRGVDLHVPRSALPETGPDEFYYHDLEGLEALQPDGRRLGRVARVENFGAGEVLEVIDDDGRSLVLPFDHATVPDIDLAAGRLVVRPPDGLIDERGRP